MISSRRLNILFEGSYILFIFEVAVLIVLVSGMSILNIAASEREIWHAFLFSGFCQNTSDSVALLIWSQAINLLDQ